MSDGTYIAVKWGDVCVNKLLTLCGLVDLPNIVPEDKIHTTIIYDTKVSPEGVLVATQSSYNAFISNLDVFTSSDGNKCLVAILNCPELDKRYSELSDKYGFTSDYPEYKCHITLSYSIEDWDMFYTLDTYIKSSSNLFKMNSTGEYIEPLNENWKDEL